MVVGVEPIFPPRYRIKEIIRRAYDDHLGRQILTVCQVHSPMFDRAWLAPLRLGVLQCVIVLAVGRATSATSRSAMFWNCDGTWTSTSSR